MALGLLNKKAGTKQINKVVLLPLGEIISNPNQPRRYFDQPALEELCRSIVTNGLLQPVTVRELQNGKYELVAGERRTMAFRLLGREDIPAIVEEYSDEQSAVLALVENLQRKDLNYFEEAAGIAKLMQEQGLTQLQVSQRLGKAQSTVANKLRLLKYPHYLQERMLAAGLTERHARALLRINDPDLLESAVEHIIAQGLNVEESEEYIEHLLEEKKPESLRSRIFVVKDMRIFMNSIQKAVEMMRSSGIPVEMQKQESGENIAVTLLLPKESIYRERANKAPKAVDKTS